MWRSSRRSHSQMVAAARTHGVPPAAARRGSRTSRGAGPGVLVANHVSYIDAIVLMAAIPSAVHFVAKRALTQYPLIGTVIRKAEHLTIEKAGLSDRLAGADEVERRLRAGERLLVFAEGTFVRRPGLLPFRLGAFRAAVDTARPIVPIALSGTRHVLPDGTWLLRHAPVTVTIGAPVEPQAQGWPEMVRLRDAAVDHIARECGESAFPSQPTGSAGGPHEDGESSNAAARGGGA
jgi:fatty-acyl-CoA synthase